jgi:pyridoxamine 5'-phosphate oxidase
MVNSEKLRESRKEYQQDVLVEALVDQDPFRQFKVWFEEATRVEAHEPNAFALSTVSAAGVPSVRMVLLKDCDERGFVFYTNFESRKGIEIATHTSVAMLFYWPSLERQLRIEGSIEKIADQESDKYFNSRPVSAMIGAIVSQQSREVCSRDELEKAYAKEARKYESQIPKRPPYWGGYRITPNRYEFWQGRESRLHDRLVYELVNKTWRLVRLWP